ncbi:MAG: DUF721 domain-containing protein [Flavobacteriaceae bacterium]|jgi:hypothetical protein
MKKNNSHEDPQPLKDVLREFITQKPLLKGVEKVRICEAWGKVMGANVLKYTSETRYSYNILYVSLSSAPLKMELGYKLDEITTRINNYLGKEYIKKITLI